MIKPLGNLVLIEEIKEGEKTTTSGLVIAGPSADQGPRKGKIIAIGNGEQNYKGQIISVPEIDEGDIVLYPAYSGTDVEDSDGKKYILLTSKNILAIIGDK